MQKSALSLQIELDTPSLSVPYGERPPLVKGQEPNNGEDVVLKGRIIVSSLDPASAPPFKIKEAKVSFMTRTLLANAGLDNRSVLTLYHQTVTLFAADGSSADIARQKTELGPIFHDLSSSLFTSIAIPFKMCLPKWLPPSLVASSHAKVVHTVTAKIKSAYSQKSSISAVILGRALTNNVHKAHCDVPVLVCAPLSTSSTSICSFSNSKTSKPHNLYWKVQVPRCTPAGSHIDVLLKFAVLLPVAGDMTHVKNVTFNIVQEQMRRWCVHDKSSWRVITGKRENSDSFLVGPANGSERSVRFFLWSFATRQPEGFANFELERTSVDAVGGAVPTCTAATASSTDFRSVPSGQ
ncbi:hypothetical protein V1525DRAFT_403517 [Lipomyces kononenkoae]|uniref:Uncharacterized protein n=1 Tax=Lipomyces kononenkoae TaxID=34357 RepID=A0ACC3T0X1_LIPKO